MASTTSVSLVQTQNVAGSNSTSASNSTSSSSANAVKINGQDNWKIIAIFAGFLGVTTILSSM
ncbi:hypothetical protein DASC09_018560 [Saccharomycopsis crataegensis]|uniref:Uncharacterized protein n=1 Tax=Saccharomycopsis crataegensis TaxID=43959 RepID=A0AAV5QIT9_9ASCO|nr:hypothetical protein DASC09_018560 [Saccharomycopsis crataegensis]